MKEAAERACNAVTRRVVYARARADKLCLMHDIALISPRLHDIANCDISHAFVEPIAAAVTRKPP